MRTSVAVLFAAALSLAANASAQEGKARGAKPAAAEKKAAPADKAAAPAKQDTDKTLYSVGLAVAKSLEVFSLTPAELDVVLKGIREGASGKAKTDLDQGQQQAVNDLARARMEKTSKASAEKEKSAGPAFLAKAGGEKGATKTASGAIVIPEKEGTGPSPKETDKVKVHYTGTLTNGKKFDSSVDRGQPAEFPLNGVIKCWTEGLQKMKVGGKARLVCPSDTAYGEQGRPPIIPGNAVLSFEVELLEILPATPASSPAPAGK
jgi:FKBP-type peptidyl-prolyl cis-trans isomerase